MIVDFAVVGVLLVVVWRLIGWAAHRFELLVEHADSFGSPNRQEREDRRRRARLRALLPWAAPWIFWAPMLAVVESPGAIAGLLVAGLAAGVAGALAASSWRVVPGLLLAAVGSLLQVALLVLLAGLATDARLDTETLAQRETVVTVRRLGRAWWEWSEAARAGAPVTTRDMDAALLLADRALGWPAIRGLATGPRLVDPNAYPELDPRHLERLLSPAFLPRVPLVDGWGQPLEVRGWLEPRDPSLPRFLVRSAGADGRFEDVYRSGAFPAERAEQDIVWADGVLLRQPETAMSPE
ncbi:MAG TPA: hypothetical protein VNB06_02465 [Thermoanaerobaculia bacterium]|nr:hypothetical protein [Thermoanaerobaculia bacterium]